MIWALVAVFAMVGGLVSVMHESYFKHDPNSQKVLAFIFMIVAVTLAIIGLVRLVIGSSF